jgi:hypothetical protein
MKEEDRNREERRREERQREDEEVQHRQTAEDDPIYHEGLRSGDRCHWLAKRGYISSIESSEKRQGPDDEVSMVIAPIDKQAWRQEAMEAVYEAQQSLWASILYLSRTRDSSRETRLLNEVVTATTLSADDENSVGTLDRYIQSTETDYRFSDLAKDLRWLKSKIEEYRLVKEIGAE